MNNSCTVQLQKLCGAKVIVYSIFVYAFLFHVWIDVNHPCSTYGMVESCRLCGAKVIFYSNICLHMHKKRWIIPVSCMAHKEDWCIEQQLCGAKVIFYSNICLHMHKKRWTIPVSCMAHKEDWCIEHAWNGRSVCVLCTVMDDTWTINEPHLSKK